MRAPSVPAACAALAGRLVPEGCTEGDVLVRGAAGWECTSDPMCPPGFAYLAEGDFIVCTRDFEGATDVMVKAGDFWIDRYEVSACPDSVELGDETGTTTTGAACSVAGEMPQASITWFQAAQMCANAGKRLCSNTEWQTAASGTPDAGPATDGVDCNVSGDGEPAVTGEHTDCVSRFGAYDMGGNLGEWVSDWFAGAGRDDLQMAATATWDATYGSDAIGNLSGAAKDSTGWHQRPAAGIRGGTWISGSAAGVFALDLRSAPSDLTPDVGARCCTRGGR